MGRNKFQANKGKKRKDRLRDCPEREHYEEFGEAHPIDDKTYVKRIKIKDTQERRRPKEKDEFADVSDSSDDQEETDAMSRLLATFNTNSNMAVESDDEDGEDSGSEESVDGDGDITPEELEETDQLVEGFEVEEENHSDDDDDDSESKKALDNKGSNNMDTQEANKLLPDNEEEDEEDSPRKGKDPFIQHFKLNLGQEAAEQIENTDCWSSSFEEWPSLKRIKVDVPKVEVKQRKLLLLADEETESTSTPPNIGAVPKRPRKKNFKLDDYHVLEPLKQNIPFVNESNSSCPSGLTSTQKELFAILSNYSDLYYPESNYKKYEEIRTVYAIHALNHVLKTRKRVLKHNSKMKKDAKNKKKRKELTSDVCRDQGYTRPKVLIILPVKHSAYRLIEIMSSLLENKNFEVLKQSRFREDFGPGEIEKNYNKPDDFYELFKGDSKEDFKIGLKITKSTLKLYTDFYQSDIIVASPLSLRYMTGSFELGTAKTDFLTSIEVLIIDQADVLMMQNWEHVLILMELLNKPPHNIHKLETDLNRIRMWTLDGHSALYRQTLLFSSTHIDHNRALVNKCKNFTGRIQVLNPVTDGSAQEVVVQAELVLMRVIGMRDPDTRFKFFIKEVMPQYQASRRIGIMVYIPDYCDYLRLVRYLKEDGGASFSGLNEYIIGELPKVAKIRSVFFDTERQFLLFTERFHFYRRYHIKGVRHVIFYDLPTYPHFFSEVCNLMVEGNQNRRVKSKHIGSSTVSVLYQQSDLTKLIGVLGSQRAGEIIKAKKSIQICNIGS